jgi:integrase
MCVASVWTTSGTPLGWTATNWACSWSWRLAGGRHHALACLLALNGLRISEALNADIGHLGMERGHRTLTSTRKGGKTVIIPLAPRTARAIDLCVGERVRSS